MPVCAGCTHETLFERVEIDGNAFGRQFPFEVHPLLDEVDPKQRVGGLDLQANAGELFLDGIRSPFATSFGTVQFQGLEVMTHDSTLLTTERQCRLVLFGHESFGVLLGRWHVDSIAVKSVNEQPVIVRERRTRPGSAVENGE